MPGPHLTRSLREETVLPLHVPLPRRGAGVESVNEQQFISFYPEIDTCSLNFTDQETDLREVGSLDTGGYEQSVLLLKALFLATRSLSCPQPPAGQTCLLDR